MKHRITALLAALALAIAILPAVGADAQENFRWGEAGYAFPAKSRNINREDYSGDGETVSSCLFESPEGLLTRVEYIPGEPGEAYVAVEEYDRDFRLVRGMRLEPEGPIWGGFFAGANYNFLIFGRENPLEDDSAEVIRVVKYSKDWQRLGERSVSGINTWRPFSNGSLRCAEGGGMLYIRTCHEMYASRSDGLHYQSSLTLALRESDLVLTDCACRVEASGAGYVSRSVNQYMIVDTTGRLAALDQGDEYPRAAVLTFLNAQAGSEKVTSGEANSLRLVSFPSSEGLERTTGAGFGGLADTERTYVAVFSYDGWGVSTTPADRRAEVCFVDKQSREITTFVLSDIGVSVPHIAPMSADGGYIMWNTWEDGGLSDTLEYTRYGSGSVGEIKTARAPLSDCRPIAMNGALVWYVTDGGEPVFYTLTDEGVTAHSAKCVYPDVTDGYTYEPIRWAVESGAAAPQPDGLFVPGAPCTRAEAVTLLWRALGSPESSLRACPFTDISPEDDCYPAVLWALESGITSGTSSTLFSPERICTRAHVATFLHRALGSPEPEDTGISFSDVESGSWYEKPVLWAVGRGVTNGTSAETFSPSRTCTRGQILTFLYRALVEEKPEERGESSDARGTDPVMDEPSGENNSEEDENEEA